MCSIERYEQELRLRYSQQTVACYTKQFKLFIEYFEDRDIRYLSLNILKRYILSLHAVFGYSAIVHAVSAIKFYYVNLCPRPRNINLPLPKKPKYLPVVLSFDEVQKMLLGTVNLKHRAIIETMFCHGLRRSELLNLKIIDIDSANKVLRVKQSKGLKDRNVPLSEPCLETLRDYYEAFKPKKYLFNGQTGQKYTATSLRNIIVDAAKRVGISKKVSPHTLRHSFASYLVSIDVNLAKIQEWLGHSSSKTTEIYCHIVQQDNPIKISS